MVAAEGACPLRMMLMVMLMMMMMSAPHHTGAVLKHCAQ